MGFFKKAVSAVKKVAAPVTKPIINAHKAVLKDAIPLAAAYATGGASLQVLKPKGQLMGLSKFIGGGPQPTMESITESATNFLETKATDYVTEKATNEVNRFVKKQLTPKNAIPRRNSEASIPIQLPEKNIRLEPPSRSITDSATEVFADVSRKVGGKNNLILIFGGVSTLIIFVLFMGRGRR